VELAEAAHWRAQQEFFAALRAVKKVRIQLRAEHTGNERIDTHARSGPFDGQRFGEGGHSGLTGAVSRDFKESYQRRKRADVDDAPIAPLDHVATKDPAGAKGSFEVGLKDGVPVGLGEVECGHFLGATGAIDKDLNAAEFGSVQILVNCTGRTKKMPTLDFPESDWDAIFETNLKGTLRACRIFGRHMIERRYGRIINIGSLSSLVGLFEVAAYGASKAGVASLTKTLAIEWATSGVCVNALIPGVLRTELNADLLDGTERGKEFLLRTPMRRFGKLDELAGAAVFLASDASSFVTGHLLVVDGGILASGVNQ